MPPELIGYADKLSVVPGEHIRFMVSTDLPRYSATIVRLIHGDNNPAGPGFKEQVIATEISGEYAGRKQTAYAGSYVLVENAPALAQVRSFTLQAWIYPTTPGNGKQAGLVTHWSPNGPYGFGLFIGEQGDLELRIGAERVNTGLPLGAHRWCFVAATFDAETGQARLYQLPVPDGFSRAESVIIEKTISGDQASAPDAPLLLAAAYAEIVGDGRRVGRGIYNGKLDRPHVFSRALNDGEIQSLHGDAAPQDLGGAHLVAAWDFANAISTRRVADTSRNQLHGVAINMPMRAVTDHTWKGKEYDYKHAPEQYGAIHFHDDDLEDAGWLPDLDLTLPSELKSGVYAARLSGDDAIDYIPFVIRPPRGAATAGKSASKILYLLPTNTYLAYANDRAESSDEIASGAGDMETTRDPIDYYLAQHPEFAMSIYDRHSDGTGCCYSSRLRPITNMRPHYRYWLVNAPRHFSADLYLIDWMETKGFTYDVATDEDLHHDGKDLLGQYRVMVTGTHPEYWSEQMLDTAEAFLASGGRLMYLGGNGFYWVTSFDTERPHIIEVRRGNAGSRAWNSAPGECYHSTTGELGGLWLHRGRAPNRLAGIGFTSMGWDTPGQGFERSAGSFDPRAAFIFEGVAPDDVIGKFGLVMGSAAGDELDRVDYDLGSPQHTLLLASSSGHSDYYQPVIEDFLQLSASVYKIGKTKIHADMVFFETPNDGAVFSVGSICWCGSLSHNNYDNNVSRITENVLRKFMA